MPIINDAVNTIRSDLPEKQFTPIRIVSGETANAYLLDNLHSSGEIIFNPERAGKELLEHAEINSSDVTLQLNGSTIAFIVDNVDKYKEYGSLAISALDGYYLHASFEVIEAIYKDMQKQGVHMQVSQAKNSPELNYYIEMLLWSSPNNRWEDYQQFGGPSSAEIREAIPAILEIARLPGDKILVQQAILDHEKNHSEDMVYGTYARQAHLDLLESINQLSEKPLAYRDTEFVKGKMTCDYQRRALFEAKSILTELDHQTLGDGTSFAWNLYACRTLNLLGDFKKQNDNDFPNLERAIYKNLNPQPIETRQFSAHNMGTVIVLFGPEALDISTGYLNFRKILGKDFEENEPALNAAKISALIAKKIVNFNEYYAINNPGIDLTISFREKLSKCVEKISQIETQYFRPEYLKD